MAEDTNADSTYREVDRLAQPLVDPDVVLRNTEEILANGVLWAINRYCLHPMGVALALDDTEKDGAGPFYLHVNDGEPYVFSSADDDKGYQRFQDFLEHIRRIQAQKSASKP